MLRDGENLELTDSIDLDLIQSSTIDYDRIIIVRLEGAERLGDMDDL